MVQLGAAGHRFAGAMAGAALLLAISGCAAESPPASSSPGALSAPVWTATLDMDGARTGHTATLLPDGKVLVAGGGSVVGGSGVDTLDSAALYDPSTGSWIANGTMHWKRFGHTATQLPDGKVLVAGGGSSSETHAVASAELYDPTAAASWTAIGNMDEERTGHTATLLPDGRVLVVGGSTFTVGSTLHAVASAELYDPSSGSWTAAGNMAGIRYRHTATLLPDGRVLVVGGYGRDGQVASAELYDPSSGSWTATGNMGAVRAGHTATPLPDGRVLVAGGGSSSAELFDPSSASWTAAGNMGAVRAGHTATLLADGTVLVAGGAFSTVGSAELYDPGSGSWTATGNLITPRVNQTATLLPDGKVLVAGGEGLSGRLASAELYDPSSGS